MKVSMAQLDYPNSELLDLCRVSVGKCRNGHVLFIKVDDQSLTMFTDMESLTRLRDGLNQYLENPQ